jgi:ribonuclease VapC
MMKFSGMTNSEFRGRGGRERVVIDTSVLVAIALNEPIAPALLVTLKQASARYLCSVSLLEAGMVLRARMKAQSAESLYSLVEDLGCRIIPFDEAQAKAAIAAFGRFGKGTGHRAQLNFGDCAVYALAALRGEPVLATGGDFRATDLDIVPLRSAK